MRKLEKSVANRAFYSLCLLVLCITFCPLAFSGCDAVNDLVSELEEKNPYILTMSDAYYASLLSEEQVRENCEILGVDYNCLNMNSDDAKSYAETRKKVEVDTAGVLTYRYEAPDNVAYMLVDESDEALYDTVELVVEKINEIGKAIDDPFTYEVKPYSDELAANYANTYIHWVELPNVNAQYRYRVTYNNKLPFVAGEVELSSTNINADYKRFFDYCGYTYDYEEHIEMYNRYIAMGVLPKDTPIYCRYNDSEILRILMHELSHAVTHQEDMYIKLATEETISNPDTLNSRKSIMNGSYTFEKTDILLRAAKYSPYVEEKADEYIKFATNYNYIDFYQNINYDRYKDFFDSDEGKLSITWYCMKEMGLPVGDTPSKEAVESNIGELKIFDPSVCDGEIFIPYGINLSAMYYERFSATSSISYTHELSSNKNYHITWKEEGYKFTNEGVCYYLGFDSIEYCMVLYVFVPTDEGLVAYVEKSKGFHPTEDQEYTDSPFSEFLNASNGFHTQPYPNYSGEYFTKNVLPTFKEEMLNEMNGKTTE